MLSENQLEIISEAITPLFDYLEHEIIADIARRIAKTLTYSRTAELEALALKKLGYSPNKIRQEAMKILQADKTFQKVVEDNTIEYKREVKKIIDKTVEKAKKSGDELIASAGDMSWIDDMRVWESGGVKLTDDSFLDTLIKAYQMQSTTDVLNLSKSMGFKAISGWESIENLYRTELNKALIKLTSGAYSQSQVVRDTIHSLAQSGLRSVDYASGRSTQLDSAVRLAVRTASYQLGAQIQKQNIQNTDVNLVYVSQHENARNQGTGIANHEEWQGKVYYVEPGVDYTEEAKRIGQDSIGDLWENTGYSLDNKHESNPLGLYGYNCRHRIHPWWEGSSQKPERIAPKPIVKWNDRELDGFAQSQEMRRMERNIRNLKREREALRTLGEPLEQINARISEHENIYRTFCYKCNQRPLWDRCSYECGTSDLTKTDAWKRYKSIAN